jgi:transposase-like protein
MEQSIETTETKFTNFVDFGKRFPDEKACRDYLAKARWNGKPICSHCGYWQKIYNINDGKLYKCARCKKQFTVRLGSIFEDSALPLQKWFMAIYILTAHRKGISSCQLARDVQVTQKTAWHMLHRIRYAIRTKSFERPLEGIIEADETYVGGQEKNKHFDKRTENARGRSTETKAVVFGMLERQGEVRTMPVENVQRDTLHALIKEHVAKGSKLMTDELHSYKGLSDIYDHQHVNHGKKQYVQGDVHTQNIECFWSLMKRGINGVYHWTSKKHLHRYTDEYAYRYNSRKITDIERFHMFFLYCSGRLTYKELID